MCYLPSMGRHGAIALLAPPRPVKCLTSMGAEPNQLDGQGMSPAMVMTLKTDCNVECLRLMFRAGAVVNPGGAYCWGDDIDPWLGRKLQNVADDDLVKYEAIQLLIGVTDARGWSEGCSGIRNVR